VKQNAPFGCLLGVALASSLLSADLAAAPPGQRPWGQSADSGSEVYHRELGQRRYNPWSRLRDVEQGESRSEEARPPRYIERKKQTLPERDLPQFYDRRGVPNEGYFAPGPGAYPPAWGGMRAPMPWGTPYQPMFPPMGLQPWGYGGW